MGMRLPTSSWEGKEEGKGNGLHSNYSFYMFILQAVLSFLMNYSEVFFYSSRFESLAPSADQSWHTDKLLSDQ